MRPNLVEECCTAQITILGFT